MSLAGYADIFLRNTLASGVVPQLSAVLGPCAGGAVYSPAITDFVFMVESTSHMFITGPDVIRAVTHEEVSKEELGGAAAHVRSGVAHRAFPDEPSCLEGLRALLAFLPQNNREDPPRLPTKDPADRADAALDDAGARRAVEAVRHAGAARAGGRRRRAVRDPARSRAQHHRRVRAPRRAAGRAGRQPAGAPGGLPGHRRVGEGGALRPLLRLLQHPAGDVRRRPRVPARHRAGVGRHHQARRQAAVRVRRGDGAEADGDHAQGVRRRLRRHVVQAHPRRRQLRVPVGGDRGDGARGGGQHRVPRRAGEGGRSGGGARALRRRIPRQVRQPVRRRRARLRRRGDPPARDAGPAVPRAGGAVATSATRTPPRSTGTFRCEVQLPRSIGPLSRCWRALARCAVRSARSR